MTLDKVVQVLDQWYLGAADSIKLYWTSQRHRNTSHLLNRKDGAAWIHVRRNAADTSNAHVRGSLKNHPVGLARQWCSAFADLIGAEANANTLGEEP